ncbi:MAG: prephenate dehydrogenase/arogenate dehydrogenase family protein [Zoogloeaceae bacterium]|jgi:prephenate dehydrogenase|nr:prephenate dehydrogenase/arogenate dehydrogenase family protein [Zoogloeaceae bacterium]
MVLLSPDERAALPAEFGKVIIYGVGLIGGSFALALKSARAAREVVGFGRSAATLAKACELGVIDRAGVDAAHELADADLVLAATPVGQMSAVFAGIAPHIGAHTTVTDGGSTKNDVVRAAYAAFGDRIGCFVPAHPIAGAENSGASAAKKDLFQGRKVVMTPLPENSAARLERVRRAWRLCGAETCELTPEQHDRVFAAVSHLPHLLSFALVRDLAERPDAPLFFDFAASGFRDFTRIAASHPEMWRDICLANRAALLREIDAYQQQLNDFKAALQKNDGAALEQGFAVACRARRAWGDRRRLPRADAGLERK